MLMAINDTGEVYSCSQQKDFFISFQNFRSHTSRLECAPSWLSGLLVLADDQPLISEDISNFIHGVHLLAGKMDCFLQWMLRNALLDQLGPRELKFEILTKLKTISFSYISHYIFTRSLGASEASGLRTSCPSGDAMR